MTFHGFYSPLPISFPSATFIDLDARKQRFSYHRDIHAVVPSLHETLFFLLEILFLSNIYDMVKLKKIKLPYLINDFMMTF